MKQKLILLALVTGLIIVSQSSLSLGMGKIQVYSALNEPLQSSIDLLANDDEELLNLEVKLASSEDYQKVGLDKTFVPSNIMVAFDEENPYQINVTSNGPVSEPIVSLLLDVNWNNGRILRELTVLLDPPVYESANNNAQINNVVVESVGSNTITETVKEYEEPELQSREENTRTITNNDFVETRQTIETTPVVYSNNSPSEVYVEAGDTLWRIANNNKVGNLSAQQMMMAIYNKNPNAFIDNNINQLIKGSRLDMPTNDEANNIGFSEALAQVKSHHQSWSPVEQDYNTFQTEETAEVTYEAPESNLDYGVQLSGGNNQGSDSGQSNAEEGTAANVQAIEEDLYNKDAENNDLKERISELEDIVEQQQDVIEISDDGLANLENQLENVADDTTQELNDAADDVWDKAADTVDGAVDAIDPNVDTVEGVDAESNDVVVDDMVADKEVDAVETKPVTTPSYNRPEQKSFVDTTIDWVMNNLVWVLSGLAGLIALLFLPKILRGSDDGDEDETSFLDDIKNRKRKTDDEEIDDVDTKMNQPLSDLDDAEDIDTEDDVLAELDSSIDFDDATVETEAIDDMKDDMTEFAEGSDFAEDEFRKDDFEEDGFDLDGFLNDDNNDDITETKDHSATLADVSFDDEEDIADIDAEVDLSDDDMSFDDLDLSLDDEVEELSDDVNDVVDDFKTDAENKIDEGVDEVSDSIDIIKDEVDEFSFDDDDEFDFDLSEELEELEEEKVEEIADADINETVESEDFNDMLDISDEDTETFEITDEAAGMDEEIDLGLEDLMDDTDAIDTKLDLAKAYIDMGDAEGAKNLLDEIYAEGTEEQISEAKKLLDDM